MVHLQTPNGRGILSNQIPLYGLGDNAGTMAHVQ